MKHDFLVAHVCNKYLQKNLCSLYDNMSSQEEHNKLTDEEKLKLIEFYEENSELWVTQGITRSQKALKKEELVEEFDRKFLIEILEKAFHAVRASFLRDHKKYQKEEKLPNKGWKFYESVFFFEKRDTD